MLREAKDGISSVQVTNNEILTASLDCKVRRYDLRNGELISDFVGGKDSVFKNILFSVL